MQWPRLELDTDAYVREVTARTACFICTLSRSESPSREVVLRDDRHLVFLLRFPTLEGYVLVAPTDHREHVVGDFSLDEHLALQALVFRVGSALSAVVPTERLYVLRLGSARATSHVHWHVAALPPGVALEDQQFSALMVEHRGYLDIPEAARDGFAARLRDALATT